MERDFNFTTAFAMRCDAEQFESVKKEFIQMGYETECADLFDENRYLINNYACRDCVTNILEENKAINNRLTIETFNRDLCLALAAMTDKPDGIVGEWFVHVADTDQFFTKNKLYKKQTNVTFGTFTDDNRDDHGMGIDGIKEWFRKATVDELIKYFTEAKPERKQPEPDPQIEALQKRIEELERNVKKLTEANQPQPQPASRFADKQPLRAWDDDWSAKRNEIFWDAKNECAYWADGDRNGYSYDNYEPIPADQIPAWMIEAVKHLED